jgi:hypothetical protein
MSLFYTRKDPPHVRRVVVCYSILFFYADKFAPF